MSVFQEVSLTWDGKEYVVPPDKVMGLVAVIEDFITIEELSNQSGVKRAKVANAFAAAVRYAAAIAGASIKLTGEQVYEKLFGSDAMQSTTTVVYALLALMIPPEHLRAPDTAGGQGTTAPGKKKAAGKKKTGARS
jgi:hypothetical protein